MISYNKKDFLLLKNYFPDLYYDEKRNIVKGELSFSVCYKNQGREGKDRWVIFPHSNETDYLKGYYEIAIHLNDMLPIIYETNKIKIPVVYEISNKIKALAKKLGKSYADLHLYDDYKCCLGLGINKNLLLSEFIVNWVYPYFVWQAYFEKYNEIPPWGEYSHNIEDAKLEYRIDNLLK